MNDLLQAKKEMVRVNLRVGTERIVLMVQRDWKSLYRTAGRKVNKLFNDYKAKMPSSSNEHIYALTALACALDNGQEEKTK